MNKNRYSFFVAAIALCVGSAFGKNEAPQVSMDIKAVYLPGSDSAEITWFPSNPDSNISYKVLCFNAAGETVFNFSAPSEIRSVEIPEASILHIVEVTVYAQNAQGMVSETAPIESLYSASPQIATESAAEPSWRVPSATGGIEIPEIACDSQSFPFIYLNVRVSKDGSPVGDLTTSNFSVTEDRRIQTDFFQVTPPGEEGGVRLADVVFLIDTSGSMSTEIASVRDNVIAFADGLQASGIDYRLGLVHFGNSSGDNPGIISGGLTDSVAEFKSWVAAFGSSGSHEPGFEAIRLAIQELNFRPGSQKVFILITDEDSDDRNKQDTIDLILANNVTVHTAIEENFGTAITDYGSDAGSVRGVSGGLQFKVEGPYDQVLSTIAAHVGDTYIVRYKSDNPLLDSVERLVVCSAEDGITSGSAQCTYVAGGTPRIQRTPDTIDLHSRPLAAGLSPRISSLVTDAAAPFVQEVTLYARTAGSASGYTAFAMSLQTDGAYAASIPADIVQEPGVDYYIRATDGQVTSSDPWEDPSRYPYQLAVLPNVAPTIDHSPAAFAELGQPHDMLVRAADTTHQVSRIDLYWRHQGSLLWRKETADFASAVPGEVMKIFQIEAAHVVEPGIEYYIRATDDLGVSAVWPLGGAESPQFLPIGTDAVGSLTVAINPATAVAAGAKWRRAGTTTWLGSGDTETEVPVGHYAVEFKPVAGFKAPVILSVAVTPDQTTVVSGTYTPTPQSVISFSINDGAESTTSRNVALNNSCVDSPTHYMASESSWFSGARWQPYSSRPQFALASGNGTRTVYFRVLGPAGVSATAVDFIILNEPSAPVAKFHGAPVRGVSPLTVSFVDESTAGPASWSWDFENDGTADSAQRNPQFTYTTPGIYTVKLEVSNLLGSDTEAKMDYIHVEEKHEGRTFYIHGNVPLTMVKIPAGDCMMGSEGDFLWNYEDERPAHSVAIDYDFYMAKYELSQQQWRTLKGWPMSSPSVQYGLGDSYPAYYVSWNDAQDYIAALNAHIQATGQGPATFRLPSEAEWEYACRAGSAIRFSFGYSDNDPADTSRAGQLGEFTWFGGNNSPTGSKPVGSKKPNAWGLYDMGGNVYEWCQDSWHGEYTGAPSDGSAWESLPASQRIFRGGDWLCPPRDCRSANRDRGFAELRKASIGFRLSATIPEETKVTAPWTKYD